MTSHPWHPWIAYGFATALNVVLVVYLMKWRGRALLAETELEARKVLHVDDTPSTFDRRERITK